jgi:vancomycin permeability regulator SanA
MNMLIIPQKMIRSGDLVVLPRAEYESLFLASKEAKKDWVYEKPIAQYMHTRIAKAERAFKTGKVQKWEPKKN